MQALPLRLGAPPALLRVLFAPRLTRQILAALGLLASLAVLASAVAAQRDFLPVSSLPGILALWGKVALAGVAVWVVFTPLAPAWPEPPSIAIAAPTPSRRRVFRTLLALSVTGVALGLGSLAEDLNSTLGSWLWMLGVAGLVVAFGVRELRRPALPTRAWLARQSLWNALGWANTALAFALRLLWPNDVPAFFNFDEANTAVLLTRIYHHQLVPGQHMPYPVSPWQTGYLAVPNSGYYVYAAVMQVVGETVAGLHFTSAVFGALGVWVVYRWLRDYVRPWAAVAAAFLLSVSHNYLFWSRTGIDIIEAVLASALALWLILRGLRGRGYLPFVAAGLLIGWAPHSYWSASALGPILGIFFLCLLVRQGQRFVKERWSHLLALGLATAVTFAPLGLWYFGHPGSATERAGAVMFQMNDDYRSRMYPGLTPEEATLEQVMRNLWGLAVAGDGTPQFYPVQQPLLDPFAASLMLLGVLGFTMTVRRSEQLLLALWLWVPTLLIVLLTDRPPPMTRLLIVVPALYVVLGYVLDRLGGLAERAGGGVVLGSLAVPLLVGVGYAGYWNVDKFFVQYPLALPRDRWTELGRAANDAGTTYKTYSLGGYDFLFQKEHVSFIAHAQVGDTIDPKELPIAERGWRNAQFVVAPADNELLERVQRLYPGGQVERRTSNRGDLLFTTYRVPAAVLAAAAPADASWLQPDAVMGRVGKRFGELTYPHGLAVGPDGRVYVTDSAGRIVVYAADGDPVRTIGRPGTGAGEFTGISHVAVSADGQTVVGLDPGAHRLQLFDRDGRWLKTIGAGVLRYPGGVAFGVDGSILVADSGQPALLRLAPSGELLGRIGGSGAGQLQQVGAVATGVDGSIYALDLKDGRLVRFGADGGVLTSWTVPFGSPPREAAIAVADADEGAVYVASPEEGAVYRFKAAGQLEWTIGRNRDKTPRFGKPVAVATDRSGSVYTMDGQGHLIYRFDVPKRPL